MERVQLQIEVKFVYYNLIKQVIVIIFGYIISWSRIHKDAISMQLDIKRREEKSLGRIPTTNNLIRSNNFLLCSYIHLWHVSEMLELILLCVSIIYWYICYIYLYLSIYLYLYKSTSWSKNLSTLKLIIK